ncbi:hypothetical protein JCM10213v2_000927 [Rhodosporidiobolus nylandii]
MIKPAAGSDAQDFQLQGIFIHPDHLALGFFADELACSPSSDTSSLIGYEDEQSSMEEEVEEASQGSSGLALSCGSASQEEMEDYFQPRPGSSNPSPFFTDSTFSDAFSSLYMGMSPSSSAATTPTCATPSAYSPSFSRRSSCASVYAAAASPSIPATFSFATFAPTCRPAAPRAPSPPRSKPYSRSPPMAAAMARAVSSPVETQRQHDERQRALETAEVSMDERTVKMARTKSMASAPTFGGGAPMSRSASPASRPLFSPLANSFGEDWGAELPRRHIEPRTLNTFPYTVARPPVSPHRNARAHSFAGTENHFTPPPSAFEHRNSLPTAHLSFGSPDSVGPASPSLVRQQRRRSRLIPLTPIVPQSPEQASATDLSSYSMAASPSSSIASPSRNRLQRGLTF